MKQLLSDPDTISNILQVIGILTSLFTSIVAIVISVKSLKQNSQMLEESTRPYIGIYGVASYVKQPNYYIVLKNFGQSSALITDFSSDLDLSLISLHKSEIPFKNIVGTAVMPGQSFRSVIDINAALARTKHITFSMTYTSGVHTYNETILLNLTANLGNLVSHNTSKGQEIRIISETLQDMHIHSL